MTMLNNNISLWIVESKTTLGARLFPTEGISCDFASFSDCDPPLEWHLLAVPVDFVT